MFTALDKFVLLCEWLCACVYVAHELLGEQGN